MRLIAIMPARNEGWVIGLSLRALLMWVDEVVVSIHASTDDTQAIVSQVAAESGRVLSVGWGTDVWLEMAQRQSLLNEARTLGATHIVTIDADEILTGDLLNMIRCDIAAMQPGVMLSLPWLCLRNSLERVHDSGMWGSAVASLAFWDQPAAHWKSRNGYDFHHREPMGVPWRHANMRPMRNSGLMHLQFLSDRRLLAKQALYKMLEVLRWPGRVPVAEVDKLYSNTVDAHRNAPGSGAQVPDAWLRPYEHLMRYLKIDADPWQEAQVRRLVEEHGIERFAGLNLFGVPDSGPRCNHVHVIKRGCTLNFGHGGSHVYEGRV